MLQYGGVTIHELAFLISHLGYAFLLESLGWVVWVVHSLVSDHWLFWLLLGDGGGVLWFASMVFWIWNMEKTLARKDRVGILSCHHVEQGICTGRVEN